MLTALTFSLAALAAPSELDAALADTPLSRGKAALAAKDVSTAEREFKACIAAEEPSSDVGAACRWELGWALWLRGDWRGVVDQWEASRSVVPHREGIDRYLKQARDNLGLEGLLAKGREGAAETFRSAVPAGTTVRLRAVGDMMIGTDFPSGVLNPEVESTFSDVQDWLSDADVTFGNLEGPLCDGGKTSKCKPGAPAGSCYAFRSPSGYKDIYRSAGFDVVSTANNHAGDFGVACREETETALASVGIAHTGRPGDIASLEANGLKIAVVGFHTSRNSHYVNDHETAAQLVRALDTEHDLVIVSFHGGAEGSKALHVPHGRETFYGENRGDLRAFTHTVVDAGADLVWGHGPHVLRGMEIYEDRLIAYSMGNFATYGRFNTRGQQGLGVVLETVLDAEGRFVAGRLLPTRQVGEGVPTRDPEAKALDTVRMLSSDDFPETGVLVAQDGTLKAR
ncbi:MAG: CapA family protein [Myxococcota bacterium]|nr:CapA family protein [Myxococcota bacterium]